MAGWPDRRLLDLTGARHPIIQAPMAGASDAALAVAVIRAGGIGSLPCAMLSPEEIVRQVAAVRAAAGGPINLNFFCHRMSSEADDAAWREVLQPYYAEFGIVAPDDPPPLRKPFDATTAEVVEHVRPDIVSFHFGLPDPALLDRVKASGAVILGNATSVDEGRACAAAGCEAVIAQGWEAGGHAGVHDASNDGAAQLGLFALVPQIADATGLPVIAAGGIADARGIAAALMLGASGVQIGTAYLKSPEARISPMHRALLDSPEAEATRFTTAFSGGRARGLANRLMRELGATPPGAPPFPYASQALAPLRKAAESRGDAGFSPLWAGQAARLGRGGPAGALTERLARETLALLNR
ncbi:nitronate monooxygenase [Sphingomonas gilva]|uniref:Nitronate monooxygenase n=1 Tax=Sphingomonas gilva TaxID=2305907 RepID=A0A396RRA3_9SPHN|nr:nitronate monooxygenase family protein [Sphingomonas gilva]RHW16823.1 nitronate monooxygenase [Sphingomonas gilva]